MRPDQPSDGVAEGTASPTSSSAGPTEGLPDESCAPSSTSCRYALFAVISHKGDLSGGHYVVFVRPGGGRQWYQCDDAWVTAVSERDVLRCQAYMLFYEHDHVQPGEQEQAANGGA